MMTLVTAFHISACVFLILVVLLQTGKGADMGAVFGGSSSTIFGSSGAGNFLTKLTTGTAVLFMLTSLLLSYGVARRTASTVFDQSVAQPPAAQVPVGPEQSVAAGSGEQVAPPLSTGEQEEPSETAGPAQPDEED